MRVSLARRVGVAPATSTLTLGADPLDIVPTQSDIRNGLAAIGFVIAAGIFTAALLWNDRG